MSLRFLKKISLKTFGLSTECIVHPNVFTILILANLSTYLNTKQRSLGCQLMVLQNTTCVFIKNKITNMHSQWMPPLWGP